MRSMNPYPAQEIAWRGKELYERRIRTPVEPEHEGRFLVVNVGSGSYILADDEPEAFDLAREDHPEGVLYLLRVGHRAAHRIGVVTPRP